VTVNAATLGVSGEKKLDLEPTHLSLSPDGKRLYVASAPEPGKSRVQSYDAATLGVPRTLNVTADLTDLAALDGDRVMLATRTKAFQFTMKGAKEREWSTAPDRPYVRVSGDGKVGYVVPSRGGAVVAQAWPMDGGPVRAFEVKGLSPVARGDFTVSEDGAYLLLGRGAVVRVPAK
jgi:DNA-binding beta-propeller fold protein YncE